MKKVLFVLLACLAAAVPGHAAQPALKDFRYLADVAGPVRDRASYSLHLRGAVLERCAAACGDLRLFGPNGQETPFVLIESIARPERAEIYPLEIIGSERSAGAVVLTLRLPERHRPVSVLELDITGRDFRKRVLVEASNDRRNWREAARDGIYDFSSKVDLRKTRIEFKARAERYLRLRLTDGEPEAAAEGQARPPYKDFEFSADGAERKDLRITAVRGMTGKIAAAVPECDREVVADRKIGKDKNGDTVIDIRSGLPLNRLVLDIADPSFHRTARLYAADGAGDEAFALVSSGALYRFPLFGRDEERIYLEYRGPKRAAYRVVIENGGNPPLAVRSVSFSWIRRSLYFIGMDTAEHYTLAFGGGAFGSPNYDLAHFITPATLDQNAYEHLSVGEVRENPDFAGERPGSLRARFQRGLLTAVVLLFVAGLGYLLFTLIRKMRRRA